MAVAGEAAAAVRDGALVRIGPGGEEVLREGVHAVAASADGRRLLRPSRAPSSCSTPTGWSSAASRGADALALSPDGRTAVARDRRAVLAPVDGEPAPLCPLDAALEAVAADGSRAVLQLGRIVDRGRGRRPHRGGTASPP
ncbi:MAG: hypothetical protein R3F59_06145 [Myxococcota bacterium]